MNVRVVIRIISLSSLIVLTVAFLLSIIYPLAFSIDLYDSLIFKLGFLISIAVFYATKKEKIDSSFERYKERIAYRKEGISQNIPSMPHEKIESYFSKYKNISKNKFIKKPQEANTVASQTSAEKRIENKKNTLVSAPSGVVKENTRIHFENDLDRAARTVRKTSLEEVNNESSIHFENDLDRAIRETREASPRIRIKDWFAIILFSILGSLLAGFIFVLIASLLFQEKAVIDPTLVILLSIGLSFFVSPLVKKRIAIGTQCVACLKQFATGYSHQETISEQTIWKQESKYDYETKRDYINNVPYTRRYYWQFISCDYCGHQTKFQASDDRKE